MTEQALTSEEINYTEPMTDAAWRWAVAFAQKPPVSVEETDWGMEYVMARQADGSVIKRMDIRAGEQAAPPRMTLNKVIYLLKGELEIVVPINDKELSIILFSGELFRVPLGLTYTLKATNESVVLEWSSSGDGEHQKPET